MACIRSHSDPRSDPNTSHISTHIQVYTRNYQFEIGVITYLYTLTKYIYNHRVYAVYRYTRDARLTA